HVGGGERGVRAGDPFARNTVQLAAVAAVKKLSHLPVLVDPSHGTGVDWLVEPMAKAAIAAGADGIMVEVHPDKERALSDGQQALNLAEFAHLMTEVRKMAAAVRRTV
ncbi:MAG: 3-deoxy-7-phosphoheptulonate synthase, partial [Acidaminococcaceae bacterium]|nr:3-deoxy-7-phosphoheptulonate synthase [Acidaminococcaceae bacterium]